jgi:hypothetical protein
LGRGSWGFSWGLKERDVGGSNGGSGAVWREWRRRGGGGGGVEEKAVAWRPGDFNVTGGGFVVESGESGGVVVESGGVVVESGGVVVEGAEVWLRRQYVGFQRERERGICDLYF